MNIQEMCESTIILIVLVGIPLGLLYIASKKVKPIKRTVDKEKQTEEYTIYNVPRLVEGNRDNVIQLCIIIFPDWEEKRQAKFPKDIGSLINHNMQIYGASDFYNVFSDIGDVLYEYLVVDKTTTEIKEISGVTDNYAEIQKIIDEIKRH